MRSKVAAALIGALLASSVRADIYTGQTTGQEISQDWASLMVSHGADVRIRATTHNSVGASVYLDFLVPSCALVFELNLPFSKPSDTDISSFELPLAIRVDANDVIQVKGSLNPVSMGDATYILTLSQIQNFDSFTSTMRRGEALRVKEMGDPPYFYAFSLHGFSQSFDRARNACERVSGATQSQPSPRPGASPPRKRGAVETPIDTSKWF